MNQKIQVKRKDHEHLYAESELLTLLFKCQICTAADAQNAQFLLTDASLLIGLVTVTKAFGKQI